MLENKPDLIETIVTEGILLRKQGRNFLGLCPFHEERNPSFTVNPKHQTFYCYGCGAHGDVISFVMQYKSFTFKEALVYLHINDGGSQTFDPVEGRKKDLVKLFRRWCFRHYDQVAREYRGLNKLLTDIRTIEDLELMAWIFHELPMLEYRLDILQFGDDESRFALFKEVNNGEV
jgi:hypothetical protein